MLPSGFIRYIKYCLRQENNYSNAFYKIWWIKNISVNEYISCVEHKEMLNSVVSKIMPDAIIEFDDFERDIKIKINKSLK